MCFIDFHIHSKYSFDSLLEPRTIIKVARKKNLLGVAVTDHNTIRGGIETSKINNIDNDNNFVVIVGIEVKTNFGDLIGLFLNEEIKSRDFFEVADNIREQGGIDVLPHPFRTFSEINFLKEIVKHIDVIEGFNARMKSDILNKKAQSFAKDHNLPLIAGSDAHFTHEIGRGLTKFQEEHLEIDEIRTSILHNKCRLYGKILPLPIYVLYEFIIGKSLDKIRRRISYLKN